MTVHAVPALAVDTSSPTPPYEQIRAQINALVGSGALRPGDRLPPVRQLAADLDLAPGTVARAYKELEGAGVVVTRRRTGTHIADSARPTSAADRAAALDQAAQAYVAAVRALGATDEDGVAAVSRAMAPAMAPEDPGR
ncbi:GntR family transcriptional regulator [Catenulispora pinisilvae]|uniref:GntR family transcriptional regulator n=1 Tax=Catenulispora pinisilvae TaxID=2705253 RepID=UPI0034DD10BF